MAPGGVLVSIRERLMIYATAAVVLIFVISLAAVWLVDRVFDWASHIEE